MLIVMLFPALIYGSEIESNNDFMNSVEIQGLEDMLFLIVDTNPTVEKGEKIIGITLESVYFATTIASKWFIKKKLVLKHRQTIFNTSILFRIEGTNNSILIGFKISF